MHDKLAGSQAEVLRCGSTAPSISEGPWRSPELAGTAGTAELSLPLYRLRTGTFRPSKWMIVFETSWDLVRLCAPLNFSHLHGCYEGPENPPHAVPGSVAFGWLCSCMVHCQSPSGSGPGQWLAPASLQHIYRSSYPPSIPRHRHSFFFSASTLSFFPRDLHSFICLKQALPGSCSPLRTNTFCCYAV